jgi:UPF0716 protein FxsA
MFYKLLLLFITLPLVELFLLVWLGSVTRVWVPVALVIVTGLAGAWLMKLQGRRVLRDIRQEVEIGNIPHDALLDGLFILVGGILLLTPGMITDLAGILLLLPPTRSILRKRAKAWIKAKILSGQWVVTTNTRSSPPR